MSCVSACTCMCVYNIYMYMYMCMYIYMYMYTSIKNNCLKLKTASRDDRAKKQSNKSSI